MASLKNQRYTRTGECTESIYRQNIRNARSPLLGSPGLSISDISSTKAGAIHHSSFVENPPRKDQQWSILFVSRTRLGNLAVIPSKRRTSSTANLTLFDNSYAVQGPKLWNAIPYHLNVIRDFEHFKDKLTKFMLSLPDKPPIRGYTPQNTNSLLCWRNKRDFTSLWGGQKMWWPRQLLTKLNICHIGRYVLA